MSNALLIFFKMLTIGADENLAVIREKRQTDSKLIYKCFDFMSSGVVHLFLYKRRLQYIMTILIASMSF